MYCILCCFSVCRKCSSFGCRRRLARIFWKFLNKNRNKCLYLAVIINDTGKCGNNACRTNSNYQFLQLAFSLSYEITTVQTGAWLQSLTHKDSLSGVRSIIIVLTLLENSKLFIFIVSLSNFFSFSSYIYLHIHIKHCLTFDVAICIDPIFAIVIVEKKADSNRRVLNVGP